MSHPPRTGPALLERTEELVRIESSLARGREGRGSFVVLEGPAGIGKTAMLAAARESAEANRMRVLHSRGAELEREFAFGIVRQLFELPLAEAPSKQRADLLAGAAGVAAGALELPGAAALVLLLLLFSAPLPHPASANSAIDASSPRFTASITSPVPDGAWL